MPLVQHALKTQKRWIKKEANLDLLAEKIESFFKSKGFETRKNTSPNGTEISIVPKHMHNVKAGIKVTISGPPHDFTVEISVDETPRFSTLLGLSTILFGGGTLVLRGLKLQEALLRLEKEFWVYVEESIPYVAGSNSENSEQSLQRR
jgi:hypothetical protein